MEVGSHGLGSGHQLVDGDDRARHFDEFLPIFETSDLQIVPRLD